MSVYDITKVDLTVVMIKNMSYTSPIIFCGAINKKVGRMSRLLK
jgi:hypothetical protein